MTFHNKTICVITHVYIYSYYLISFRCWTVWGSVALAGLERDPVVDLGPVDEPSRFSDQRQIFTGSVSPALFVATRPANDEAKHDLAPPRHSPHF